MTPNTRCCIPRSANSPQVERVEMDFQHFAVYSVTRSTTRPVTKPRSMPRSEKQQNRLNKFLCYAFNDLECRHKQILRYFGESFDITQCSLENFTNYVAAILRRISSAITSKNLTLNNCVDLLKGRRNQKLKSEIAFERRHPPSSSEDVCRWLD